MRTGAGGVLVAAGAGVVVTGAGAGAGVGARSTAGALSTVATLRLVPVLMTLEIQTEDLFPQAPSPPFGLSLTRTRKVCTVLPPPPPRPARPPPRFSTAVACGGV